MSTETTWRYEVRGSSLYDNREQRPLTIFEAGEILNAHEALLLKEGVWAAKAGLAQGKVDALEARAKWAEDVARPALDETLTIAIAQDGAKGLAMRTVLRRALAAYPQPEQEPK